MKRVLAAAGKWVSERDIFQEYYKDVDWAWVLDKDNWPMWNHINNAVAADPRIETYKGWMSWQWKIKGGKVEL